MERSPFACGDGAPTLQQGIDENVVAASEKKSVTARRNIISGYLIYEMLRFGCAVKRKLALGSVGCGKLAVNFHCSRQPLAVA